MKILAVGDPHGDLKKIKKIPMKGVDLILVTGDLGKADLARKQAFENIERKKKGLPEKEYTNKQRKAEIMEIHNSTISVLKYLSKYAPVYTIQGNVGLITSSDVRKNKEKHSLKLPNTLSMINRMKNVNMIKNTLRIFDGIRAVFLEYFLDVNWVKDFKPNDYSKSLKDARKESEKARKILKRFGKVDILVCHQPPYGILDKSNFAGAPKHWRGKHAGSKVILNYIKKNQPKYVFCGHMHEGEGKRKIGKSEVYNLGVAGYKIVEV